MDRITKRQRSANMARVRSKDTGPELTVRRAAHSLGYRYRLHRRDLPGTPDLVFQAARIAVFVHGCFWHQHAGCGRASIPQTRSEFWRAKLVRNTERDLAAASELKQRGWTVEVIWECETKDLELLANRLNSLLGAWHSARQKGAV